MKRNLRSNSNFSNSSAKVEEEVEESHLGKSNRRRPNAEINFLGTIVTRSKKNLKSDHGEHYLGEVVSRHRKSLQSDSEGDLGEVKDTEAQSLCTEISEEQENSQNPVAFVQQLCRTISLTEKQKQTAIDKRYYVIRFIGGGSDGRIFQAWDAKTNEMVALKVLVDTEYTRTSSYKLLKKLSKLLCSENVEKRCIVKMNDYFMFGNHNFVSYERLEDDLFDVMKDIGRPFYLPEVRYIVFQILIAVDFLHSRNIIHTDVKPSNIVLAHRIVQEGIQNETPYIPLQNLTLRLIDMEQCVLTSKSVTHYTHIATTLQYRSPEILLGLSWSHPCDIWSIGCTMFELCYAKMLFPFEDEDIVKQLCGIEWFLNAEIPFKMLRKSSLKEFKKLSRYMKQKVVKDTLQLGDELQFTIKDRCPRSESEANFLDLLKRMLTIDPDDRISAREALQHPWFDPIRHAVV